jgi:hypothetical protein
MSYARTLLLPLLDLVCMPHEILEFGAIFWCSALRTEKVDPLKELSDLLASEALREVELLLWLLMQLWLLPHHHRLPRSRLRQRCLSAQLLLLLWLKLRRKGGHGARRRRATRELSRETVVSRPGPLEFSAKVGAS